jgi:hypothetical protein
MLRYQSARDLYVGRSVIVEGELFTARLDELVEGGYEPAAAVDLLVRESSWEYRTDGVYDRPVCQNCMSPLDLDSGHLPYCSAVCQAAALAGESWQADQDG